MGPGHALKPPEIVRIRLYGVDFTSLVEKHLAKHPELGQTMSPSEFQFRSMTADTPIRPKILVVDDQPVNIQLLHPVFAADCQVFMATSGEQALKLSREHLPDLILLDVVMPGMSGHEVCRELKATEATREIPVIFITAHGEPMEEAAGLELGAVDFITKPINPVVVRARAKTHLTLKFQADTLRSMAFVDGLTGAFNRRYFDLQLAKEAARAGRSGVGLSLVLMDIDFFKRFNDHYGHQAGDDCLREVSKVLKSTLRRPSDLVARYGGEEFVAVLPDTPLQNALDIANRLEAAVRGHGLAHAKSDVAPVVTLSLGVATRAGDGGRTPIDPATLIAEADQQLYRAKNSGRGRACAAV